MSVEESKKTSLDEVDQRKVSRVVILWSDSEGQPNHTVIDLANVGHRYFFEDFKKYLKKNLEEIGIEALGNSSIIPRLRYAVIKIPRNFVG